MVPVVAVQMPLEVGSIVKVRGLPLLPPVAVGV